MESINLVGFWSDIPNDKYSDLPFPKVEKKPFNGLNNFLKKLEKIQMLIQVNYSKVGNLEYFDGDSICRLCNQDNGSGEYTLNMNGEIYQWPDGLIHYYKDHQVHPPNKFYQTVIQFSIKEELRPKPNDKKKKKKYNRQREYDIKISMNNSFG